MADALWVRVPGPRGPTNVQLSPAWQELAQSDYGVDAAAMREAMQEAGWQLCQAWRQGRSSYSQAVRDRAEEQLQREARAAAAVG